MTEWLETDAHAKLNLSLVVGPIRADGKHEVATVLQRIDLADTVSVRRARSVAVAGFSDDTLVRGALEAIARSTGARFEARIEKRIPVAAGLGGGSSDAGAALRLANALLAAPLPLTDLYALAAMLGSDVSFFVEARGACLARADGSMLEPIDLPTAYTVLLALPLSAVKPSTAEVYADFDRRHGEVGFAERLEALEASLERISSDSSLAELPGNDLGRSPLSAELERHGAFRAGLSGAGPIVYGLFPDVETAGRARRAIASEATTWLTHPVS